MRSAPFVTVTCDAEGCQATEEIELTEVARGAWDDRDVDDELEGLGWHSEGGSDYCPECWEAAHELEGAEG